MSEPTSGPESDENVPGRGRQTAVALLIVALGAAGALAIRFSGERTTTTLDGPPPAGPPVVVATAREGPLADTVTVAGRLIPRHEVDLAPEVAGRLVEVRADVGDRLAAGAVAFRLDDRDARLNREDRRARRAAAEARQRQAARRAERRGRLGEEGISPPESVEEARLEADVAEADLAVAEKSVDLAERALTKTAVTAPWDATVVARHADPGAWVVPGQTVLRLVDLERLDVTIDLAAADAVHLRAGDPAEVRFPALADELWEGRVRFVSAEAADGDLQFPVAVEVRTLGDERLAAGLVAEVRFELPRSGVAAVVPLAALDRDAEGTFVFVIDGEAVRRRAVAVAATRGGDAFLRSGLAAGEGVVVSSRSQLRDGDTVGAVTELRAP